MKPNRQHRYDDYEPDESSVYYDMVKITNIHSCDDESMYKIGYISRYNTKQFRFTSVGCNNEYCHESDILESEILNYKDWQIKYIK